MRKGVSPIVSTVIIVLFVFGLSTMLSPWLFNLATQVSNQTAEYTASQLRCQNTAYDFDTNYGTMGISWDFNVSPNTLTSKIVNTGGISIYNFTFEIVVTRDSGLEIKRFGQNTTYQITEADPLKPGETAILVANIPENITGTLKEVKIINAVCPSVYALNQEI